MSHPDVKQRICRYHQWLLQETEKQLIREPTVGNATLGWVMSNARVLFQSAPSKEQLTNTGHWELGIENTYNNNKSQQFSKLEC